MSHGAISDGIKAEPNLVPLLDLVFQLIMFFLICVNFVSEQFDQDIQLPLSQSARSMEKGESDVMFLNLDQHGHLLVSEQAQPLQTKAEIQYYLKQHHADAQRTAEVSGNKSGQVRTAVIIRADKRATYAQVYGLLQACKSAGYRKLQLRAESKVKG
jgi:biopolymer transport protein ExbD